jgi:uncharacterized OsmC-like protein
MRMPEPEVRRYSVAARTTDTFGRVLVSSRDQHLISDGPVGNGCPGEAIGPAELFLSGVAACGVELVQVLARAQGYPLQSVTATIEGEYDPGKRTREDVSLFSAVRLNFSIAGVSHEQAQDLVDRFKRR